MILGDRRNAIQVETYSITGIPQKGREEGHFHQSTARGKKVHWVFEEMKQVQ